MTRREFAAAAVAARIAQGQDRRTAIHEHIDNNIGAHVEKIRQYVRQPSISAENKGIRECADLTRKYLEAAGCTETDIVPTPRHPAIWGYANAGAPKTLAVYWMYDVQPVNESEWASPPCRSI